MHFDRSSDWFYVLAAVGVVSCLAAPVPTIARSPAQSPQLSPIEKLGKSLFNDTNLSVGKNQSCASCHSTDTGFTSPNEDVNSEGSVVEGSVEGRFGNAKPPSAAYAAQAPVLHHSYEDGEILFIGGSFWNGRASGKKLGNPVADQAQMPFVNPVEMGLPDAACVVERVCKTSDRDQYPVKLSDVWGKTICDIKFPKDLNKHCQNPEAKISLSKPVREKIEAAYDRIALAIGAFEASKEVNPFSSKYDAFLAGRGKLNELEMLGLKLFEGKGECANCHVLTPGPNGEPPLLTDFTFDNLGVPRNPENPFYKNNMFNKVGKAWKEQGLTVFLKEDNLYKSMAASQLGKVKVPTLRNVDKRPYRDFVKAFMHNGYFKTLKGVVNFYNTRDVKPRCKNAWTSEAEAMKQGCWPAPEVATNVNTDELGNLKLTDAEENAIVAFMKTLTD